MTLQEKALEIALKEKEKGVKESPLKANTGPEVNEYLKSIGLDPGYAWCMAFMYWCFEQAADAMGRQNPMYKTGGVLLQWKMRKDKFRATTPQPGDIYIMDFGKGTGHTGIVKEVTEKGTIIGVEGNTSASGSREGNAVWIKERQRTKILGYLRFV
jgi:hypothetical protein